MLDLYKELDLQERGEKRKNGLESEFLLFPSLFICLSLLFLSRQYSSLLTTLQDAILHKF